MDYFKNANEIKLNWKEFVKNDVTKFCEIIDNKRGYHYFRRTMQ